jgi:transposase
MQDPESKGKVENSIGYLRRDFFYGRPIIDVESFKPGSAGVVR